MKLKDSSRTQQGKEKDPMKGSCNFIARPLHWEKRKKENLAYGPIGTVERKRIRGS